MEVLPNTRACPKLQSSSLTSRAGQSLARSDRAEPSQGSSNRSWARKESTGSHKRCCGGSPSHNAVHSQHDSQASHTRAEHLRRLSRREHILPVPKLWDGLDVAVQRRLVRVVRTAWMARGAQWCDPARVRPVAGVMDVSVHAEAADRVSSPAPTCCGTRTPPSCRSTCT